MAGPPRVASACTDPWAGCGLIGQHRSGAVSVVGSDDSDTAPFPLFLLNIGSVRMLDTIVCLGPLVWLFSPAWDADELNLYVGFILSWPLALPNPCLHTAWYQSWLVVAVVQWPGARLLLSESGMMPRARCQRPLIGPPAPAPQRCGGTRPAAPASQPPPQLRTTPAASPAPSSIGQARPGQQPSSAPTQARRWAAPVAPPRLRLLLGDSHPL